MTAVARFVTPRGVEVEVSAEAARNVGYRPAESDAKEPEKAPTKKPARKRATKKSE